MALGGSCQHHPPFGREWPWLWDGPQGPPLARERRVLWTEWPKALNRVDEPNGDDNAMRWTWCDTSLAWLSLTDDYVGVRLGRATGSGECGADLGPKVAVPIENSIPF